MVLARISTLSSCNGRGIACTDCLLHRALFPLTALLSLREDRHLSNGFAHLSVIDRVDFDRLTNIFQHRQRQAATQMLTEFFQPGKQGRSIV